MVENNYYVIIGNCHLCHCIYCLHLLQTMECLEDCNELVFLYQLTRGKVKSSHAFQLAASNGIDSDVVKRAAEVYISNHSHET